MLFDEDGSQLDEGSRVDDKKKKRYKIMVDNNFEQGSSTEAESTSDEANKRE